MMNPFAHRRFFLLLGLTLLAGGIGSRSEPAEPAWQTAPYRLQVQIATPSEPTWTAARQQTLARAIAARAEAIVGGPWRVEATPASDQLGDALRLGLESLTTDALPRPAVDKLFLVAIQSARSGHRLSLREFDLPTGSLSPVVSMAAGPASKLADAAVEGMLQVFRPLGQIVHVQDQQAELWFRASALTPTDRTLSWVRPGSVFQVIVRQAGGAGQVAQVTPMTSVSLSLLEVGPERARARVVGTGTALTGRTTSRVQPLALAASAGAAALPAASPAKDTHAEAALAALQDELTDHVAARAVLVDRFRGALAAKQRDEAVAVLKELKATTPLPQFLQTLAQRQKEVTEEALPPAIEARFRETARLAQKHLDYAAVEKLAQELTAPAKAEKRAEAAKPKPEPAPAKPEPADKARSERAGEPKPAADALPPENAPPPLIP